MMSASNGSKQVQPILPEEYTPFHEESDKFFDKSKYRAYGSLDDDVEDAGRLFHPTWIDVPRDFVDRQSEEAEKFNGLLAQHLPTSIQTLTCDLEGWTFECADKAANVTLQVTNNELGSLSVDATSNEMARKYLDGMRTKLRCIIQAPSDLEWSSTGFAITLLQLAEEVVVWQRIWEEELARRERKKDEPRTWNATKIKGWNSLLDNPNGMDLSTIQDTTMDNLHGIKLSGIEDAVKQILDAGHIDIETGKLIQMRILHVEPVFRADLMARFLSRKEKILKELLNMPYRFLRECVSRKTIPRGSSDDTKEALAHELAQPTMTFHGAPRRVIESIVRYGFIIPGEKVGNTGKKLDIRCGSSFGKGIYSTPDPMYASCYLSYQGGKPGFVHQPSEVPGMRLVICSKLMGRPVRVGREDARRTTELYTNDAHSHVSWDGYQYVVFDSAQIIPCFVLHLDWGAEEAREEFDAINASPDAYFGRHSNQKTSKRMQLEPEDCPGNIQRKKRNLKAAAEKWFPYGFGAAEGTSFKIEDVADYSDHEETYGEFQYERIEQDREVREHVLESGGSWFDEYKMVRKGKAQVDT